MADVKQGASVASSSGVDAFGLLARFAPLLFLVILMAIFAIAEPRFLSSINLFNIMRQVSIVGLLAIGMTFVILTAGIDLSIGSLLAFAGLVAAAVSKGGLSNRFTVGEGQGAIGHAWYLAALAAIALGMAGGYLEGFAITRLKVPPFVVTLGGMSALRGAAVLFAGGGARLGVCQPFAVLRYCLRQAARSADSSPTWCGGDKARPVRCRSLNGRYLFRS